MVHLAGAISFAGISEGTHGPSGMTGELPKAHVGSLHIILSLGHAWSLPWTTLWLCLKCVRI